MQAQVLLLLSRMRILVLAVALLALIAVRIAHRWSGNLEITFLDVGQGDSIVIKLPDGRVMLIDAPGGHGKWNTGEAVLAELQRWGYLTLDILVMTHPDSDHSYGLPVVAQALTVKRFIYNSVFEKAPITQKIAGLVIEKKGKVEPIHTKAQFVAEGARVELMVLGRDCGQRCSENNLSVIGRIQFGGCSVLLTADIEKETEREWIIHFPEAVDVLKVAHHGSRTSSTEKFLAMTRPQLAVTSVGWRNRYHHPHPSVLHRFHQHGIRMLRTDADGFVSLSVSKNGRIRCNSYRGDCGHYRCGISSASRLSELSWSLSSAARSN